MNVFHYVSSLIRTAAVSLPGASEYANVGLAGMAYPLTWSVKRPLYLSFSFCFLVVVENDRELPYLWGSLKADGPRVFMDNVQPPLHYIFLLSWAACCAPKRDVVRSNCMTEVLNLR